MSRLGINLLLFRLTIPINQQIAVYKWEVVVHTNESKFDTSFGA